MKCSMLQEAVTGGVRCLDCGDSWHGVNAMTRALIHVGQIPSVLLPKRRDVPLLLDRHATAFLVGYVGDGEKIDALIPTEDPDPTAAMFDAPTPRERAEEKVRVLLNEDAPTKALAFTMLRAEGMDSDRAKMILRDAKWNLP